MEAGRGLGLALRSCGFALAMSKIWRVLPRPIREPRLLAGVSMIPEQGDSANQFTP